MSYRYHVHPFVGQISQSQGGEAVGAQLQAVINHYSEQGWDFYSIEKVSIRVNPGCLGGLFGQTASYIEHDQVIFRRQG